MRAFLTQFPFAGKVILLSIVEGVFIFLWSMLFVIPGIIAASPLLVACINLCETHELGVMEALNLSKQQTNGYKMQLFLLQLSFIGYRSPRCLSRCSTNTSSSATCPTRSPVRCSVL